MSDTGNGNPEIPGDDATRPKERVFLVVVDDSEEMKVALHFACRRAKTSGGRIALLHVQEPADFQHWMAVEEIMREEKREEAEELLQKLSAEVVEWSGKVPSFYMREGDRREELVKLLDEDPSISILVLGAGVGRGGPGPIIDYLLSRGASQLRVPVTLVPGSLTDEEIIAIT
jgi:nucleotide-binding universal stress UspA family protein